MKRRASKVFFPWERRRGVFGFALRARTRIVALGLVALLGVAWIQHREERSAAVRATRASITEVSRSLFTYRADHPGGCPRELPELVALGYARDIPADAWGNPLRLTCPGRRDQKGFEVSSDGPDGLPGGLDRVE